MWGFLGFVLLLLSVWTFCVYAAIEDRLKDDLFHIYKNQAILTRDDIQRNPVTAEQVTFYLFTRENPQEFVRLDTNSLDKLANKTKIVFLIHGWINSREVPWYEDLKNAFLVNDDYGVVQVDWKEPANQLYFISSINTFEVAKYIAAVIVDLNKNHTVDLNRIVLVGHSLGAQTCGFVGRRVYKDTLKKLPRIVALDPAGPLFQSRPLKDRLNKDHAEVVQVIHTDGGTFGFLEACGTIDFFVNGGSLQPGCKTIDLLDIKSIAEPVCADGIDMIGRRAKDVVLEDRNIAKVYMYYKDAAEERGLAVNCEKTKYMTSTRYKVLCDHERAHDYFIEAVLNPNSFIARKCSSWAMYLVKYCDKEEVTLGNLTTTETGLFYLETNKEKPYARVGGILPTLPIKTFPGIFRRFNKCNC